ncbi:hypothetical protein CC78DRAFT_205757 [Lojkania enalia]|uniref:DUF7730 domain-containing protein n=1 Tax=Lojkania enalia TaxID=147567 RepID=A0A9P4KCQ8_9PLEO|nr:hypothetical protein CC78DRAFT_205757 [Didymosphaeria enalia]
MDTLFSPQFFALPAELRRAIYTYFIPDQIHLSIREKKFRVSTCVQHDKDGGPDCTDRRSNKIDLITNPMSDPICGRRLRSSWGPHWRCEESAMQMREDHEIGYNITMMALFLVCKRMFSDIMEMMADIAVVYINDLDTLRSLVLISSELESRRSSTSILLVSILPNLKELSINLRLPLDTYKALDNTSNSAGSESLLSSVWMGLPLAIEHLSKLRRLRIWLDHEEPCSWSIVNERAVLSPLASLSNIPNLEVSIDLAKLHPKWESPHRHFTEDTPLLPLAIHRRYRQRYYGIETGDGSIRVEHSPDFPVLYELTSLGMTMEKVEEVERRSWKEGEDPIQFWRDFLLTPW